MARETTALGEQIRTRRVALGLSRDELAERAGISRQSVWTIETGQYGPTATTVLKLLAALEIDISATFSNAALNDLAPDYLALPPRSQVLVRELCAQLAVGHQEG